MSFFSRPVVAPSAHVYRYYRFIRILAWGMGLAFMGFSVPLFLDDLAGFACFCLVFGAGIIVVAQKSCVVLDDSTISVFSLLGRRSMRRSDVACRQRGYSSKGVSFLLLISKNDDEPPLSLNSNEFQYDVFFKDWLETIPEEQEPRRGAFIRYLRWLYPHQKARECVRAFRRVRKGLWFVGALSILQFALLALPRMPVVDSLWGLFPFAVAALCLLVPRAFVPLPSPRGRFEAPLYLLYGISGVALGVASDPENTVYVGWTWLSMALAGTLFFALYCSLLDRQAFRRFLACPPGKIVLVCFFLFLYGLGASFLVNKSWDRVPPTVYRLVVKNRYEKNNRFTGLLRVASWRDVENETVRLGVPECQAALLPPGSVVCLGVHQGGLGVSWAEKTVCPEDHVP